MGKLGYQRHRVCERGSIFVLALVILFVVFMLGASLIQSAQNAVSRAAVENRSTKAFHLAEAGVEKALYELNQPSGWMTYAGDSELGLGGGTVDVAVAPTPSDRGLFTDHLAVIANARLPKPDGGGQHSCTVRVIVHKDPHYFAYAIFGAEHVSIGNGTVTISADSYTSNNGQYGGANVGANVITGSITALPVENYLPDAILVPADAIELGDISLEADEELALEAGVYHITDLEIFGSAQITCNGKVVMYIDQSSDIATPDVRIGGNGIVNTSQIPANLTIYCAPDVVDLTVSGNAALYAGLYAPQADIVLNSGAVYGSVVGKTVALNGSNSSIHYDEALKDLADPNAAISSWEVL